jgi:hypothetical protein
LIVPRIGVSITKSTSFRGSTQEFSNVYYYEVLNLPSETEAETFIDNLTTLEKTFHSTAVTFVRGRCWSQTGSPATNNMIKQKNLSGTGARGLTTGMDRERAFLFRLRAGVDSRGNPVYLRKWYNACGEFALAMTASSSILDNTAGFNTAQRDAGRNAMQAIGDANGSPLTPKICSKNGRLPTVGEQWLAHQFLEHHQLGDMWRAT